MRLQGGGDKEGWKKRDGEGSTVMEGERERWKEKKRGVQGVEEREREEVRERNIGEEGGREWMKSYRPTWIHSEI